MTSVWAEGVLRSLEQSLDLLDAAVRDCPASLWETPMWPVAPAEPDAPPGAVTFAQRFAMPWDIAWHALETLDYDLTAEFEPWSPPPPFAGHPHWRDLATLPRAWSQAEIRGYIAHCRDRARNGLLHLGDSAAAQPLPAAHRYHGQSYAWLLAGLASHVAEHAAQIRQFISSAQP